MNNNTMNQNEMMMTMMNNMAMMMAQMQSMMANQQNEPVVPEAVKTHLQPITPVKPIVGTQESQVQADEFLSRGVERKTFDPRGKEIATMSWREVSEDKELLNMIMSWIRDDLRASRNPAYYADALQPYDTQILSHYLQMKMIGEGTYHPESTNLEAYGRNKIIEEIVELEEQTFVEIMVRLKKKVYASEKQLEVLRRNGITCSAETYWWTASREMDKIFGERSTEVTDNQMKRIKELQAILGYSAEDGQVFDMSKDRAKASEDIKQMEEVIISQGLDAIATDETKNEFVRLSKELKKKAKDFGKANAQEMKAWLEVVGEIELGRLVRELKLEWHKAHPEVSQGQIDFIVSLSQDLMKPYDIDKLKAMMKGEATVLINNLRKEKLYRLMFRENRTITRKMVDDMTQAEIDMKMKEFGQR